MQGIGYGVELISRVGNKVSGSRLSRTEAQPSHFHWLFDLAIPNDGGIDSCTAIERHHKNLDKKLTIPF